MKTHPADWLAAAEHEYPGSEAMQRAFLAGLVARFHDAASPGYARWQPNEAPKPTKTPPEGL